MKLLAIDKRAPRTKVETQQFGCTSGGADRVVIFLNSRLNRNPSVQFDTLMHEFFHAASILFGYKISREEWCARQIGQTAAQLIGKKRRNKNGHS